MSGLADSGGSGAWLARLRRPLASLGLVSHDAPPRYGWNLPGDTTYARSLPGFSGVLHVFHGQWLGIRAAAGSLPGQKLAIDASRRPSRQDIEAFLAAIDARRLTRFVFHGMSDHAALLIRRLSQQGLAGQTFLVHHGGLAQWCYAPERKLAFQAIALAREGHVKRFHMLKRNHGLLGEKSYIPMLLNMSPLMPEGAAGPEGPRAAAVFLPGTEGWIKNLHANALGAAMAEDAGEVLHYARGIALPEPWQERLRHVPYISRSGTFAHMAACRATLNVSLTECHPMVALESEAVGTPCLRARLFLDALEEHPYVRAVEVQDAASPFEIGLRLQYVLGIPEQECAAMIRDYQAALNEVSASRYKEFLGL